MGIDKNTKTRLKPIMAYGHSVLRKICAEVNNPGSSLDILIESLWDTLNYSGGVGLASPQINDAYKVFVVNSKLMYNEITESQRKVMFSGDTGIVGTFINAKIISVSQDTRKELEGCLSIPSINEDVERAWDIILEYRDANMELSRKQFSGYTAKVIQHELDHTNGKLFIDHLPSLTKKLLHHKLKKIKNGKVAADYPIKYTK
jgi:peptide deformylase